MRSFVGRAPSVVQSERETAAKNRSRAKPRDKDTPKLKEVQAEIAAARECGSKPIVATSSKRVEKASEPSLPAKEVAKESKSTKESKASDLAAKDDPKDRKREPKRDGKAKEASPAPAKTKDAAAAQLKPKEEEAAMQPKVRASYAVVNIGR